MRLRCNNHIWAHPPFDQHQMESLLFQSVPIPLQVLKFGIYIQGQSHYHCHYHYYGDDADDDEDDDDNDEV